MKETIAGLVANLYGDEHDHDFIAAEPWVATVEQLEEALLAALADSRHDAADAIAGEIRRLRGEPPRLTTPGYLYGCSALGLWRLH